MLERYIKYCSARLDGIGGDSSQVPASLTWKPPLPDEGGQHGREAHKGGVCGKVAEVLFDCHGEFEGFVLDACCERRLVESRDRGVADLILRACRDNLTVVARLCPKPDSVGDDESEAVGRARMRLRAAAVPCGRRG